MAAMRTLLLLITIIALFLLATLATPTSADTVILNNGNTIEGRITLETDDYIKIEVAVSATIKDEKIVQRTDIKEIRVQSAEDLAGHQGLEGGDGPIR